jgi:hypothetical protein
LNARVEAETRELPRPLFPASKAKPLAPLTAKLRPEHFRHVNRVESSPIPRIGFSNHDRPTGLDRLSHLVEDVVLLVAVEIVERIEHESGAARRKCHRSKISSLDSRVFAERSSRNRDLRTTDVTAPQLDVTRRRRPAVGKLAPLVLSLSGADDGQRETLPAPEIGDETGGGKHPLPEELSIDGIDPQFQARECPRSETGA